MSSQGRRRNNSNQKLSTAEEEVETSFEDHIFISFLELFCKKAQKMKYLFKSRSISEGVSTPIYQRNPL